jgi:predicted AlkP superfamily pyrophosphatase or phosphodiesterase
MTQIPAIVRLRVFALIAILTLLMAIPGASLRAQQKADDKQKAQQEKLAEQERLTAQYHNSHVIMISVDGLMPDYYLKAERFGLKIPNIRLLCKQGSYAEGSESVYPSLTYPAHTTLVTGVKPALHGIVSNHIWHDPTEPHADDWYWYANAIKTPTLWSEAHKAGLTTAAVGWPVTVDAEIDYNIPEIWQGAFENSLQSSFDHASKRLQKKFIATLPQPLPASFDDNIRAQSAEWIINNLKPNLLLLHLIGLDQEEHKSGPFSPEAFQQLEQIDAIIGNIIDAAKTAGISEQTTFMIVSDHGFLKVEKVFNPNVELVKAKYITLSKDGQITDWQAISYGVGGSTAIRLKNPNDRITEYKIIELFDKLAHKTFSPISRVIKRDELMKIGADPDAICFLEAATDYMMGDELTGSLITPSKNYKGAHGYLPSRGEMQAVFIIYGHGAQVGVHEALTKNIHIAPTVAAILGFTIPNVEGHVMRDMLTVPIPKPPPSDNAKSNSKSQGSK